MSSKSGGGGVYARVWRVCHPAEHTRALVARDQLVAALFYRPHIHCEQYVVTGISEYPSEQAHEPPQGGWKLPVRGWFRRR